MHTYMLLMLLFYEAIYFNYFNEYCRHGHMPEEQEQENVGLHIVFLVTKLFEIIIMTCNFFFFCRSYRLTPRTNYK